LEGSRLLREFKQFAMRGNVVDLAVGLILGAAFTTIVNSLVNDIIMPPVGLLLGGVDFAAQQIQLKAPTVAGDPTTGIYLRYGAFINAIIAFLVIAFVVFQISKMFVKEEASPEVKTCTYCKEPNALDASKCRACASSI
jgi:large conductance mechanosensitive channel